MKRGFAIAAPVVALLLGSCGGGSSFGGGAQKQGVTFEAIQFETSAGAFTAVLYPEAAPETVARYLEYVDTGYFVGRSFDRVVPGFVIQLTDCAISSVTRDSRTLPLEVPPGYYFSAGALGIARAASPNSGGAEFFVMDFAAGHLDGEYTVFGQVIEGIDAVRRAARVTAIDFTTGGLPAVVGDRCAVQPVEITAAERATVTLAEDFAARLPLRTAERVRIGDVIYNLEWPASLAAGSESNLTAFITVYDPMIATPAPADVTISIDGGAPIAVEGDPTADGIYHFRWTPDAEGTHEVTINRPGESATLELDI